MSNKIKFTTFELLLLFAVAVVMALSIFSYHRPEILSELLVNKSQLSGVINPDAAVNPLVLSVQEIYSWQFNLLLTVFCALFFIFGLLFPFAMYMLQRYVLKRERKRYFKKIKGLEKNLERLIYKVESGIEKLKKK